MGPVGAAHQHAMDPTEQRCRGPRGEGCFRNICRRAVLDTNCFWGSPREEIEALRQRGFALSLAHDALREAWARSLREGNKRLLEQRFALIGPHLDPEHPIAFSGSLLMSMIGRVSPDEHAQDQRIREDLRLGWEAARAGLTEERWTWVGKKLDEELEREADAWEAELIRLRALLQRNIDVAKKVGHDWYPRRRGEQIIEIQLRGPAQLHPPAPQRLHLARRLLAMKTMASREQQPQRNDFVDWRLPVHVAWPAFLVTGDFRLIQAVDDTGSLQRAWVRAPVELIEDPVYRCEPWGKPGHWVRQRFRRQPIKELRARQQAMRRRLKESPSGG